MKRVLAFGTFDPFHKGHAYFLQRAKALGNHLTVIVTRDSVITSTKGRTPYEAEGIRLTKIASLPYVDKAQLGSKNPLSYALLREKTFDTIALGYDQKPTDAIVRNKLDECGKKDVQIVRINAFHPEQYKSTYIRSNE